MKSSGDSEEEKQVRKEREELKASDERGVCERRDAAAKQRVRKHREMGCCYCCRILKRDGSTRDEQRTRSTADCNASNQSLGHNQMNRNDTPTKPTTENETTVSPSDDNEEREV